MGSNKGSKWKEMGRLSKSGLSFPFYFSVRIYIYTTSKLHIINAAYDVIIFTAFDNHLYLPVNLYMLEPMNSFKSEDLAKGIFISFFVGSCVITVTKSIFQGFIFTLFGYNLLINQIT